MIPFLERPPCLVSFSGGRDSSAVLAVATAVARREGLDLPIPITLLFPAAPEAEESSWQELVVRHLGLTEWRRLTFHDELDLVGPVAQRVLRRHGVLWPHNTHLHLPLLGEASGGTLLTGVGGDTLLDLWRWERAASVLVRRVRPEARDVLRIGLAFAPRPLRKRRLQAKHRLDLRWLRPGALRAVNDVFFEHDADEPFRWDRRVRWWATGRSLPALCQSFQLLADDAGARLAHPLLDGRFTAALARRGGRFGFGDRTETMRALFGSLLPAEVLARSDKASFDGAVWCRYSRALIDDWQGGGVPADLVDEHALRETWRDAEPHALSSSLLQALWLAASPQLDRASTSR